MKERFRTIAAILALAASGPTLAIAAGNWCGNLTDESVIDALILMSFIGLPASAYLVISSWRERNTRTSIVIDEASSRSIIPSRAQGRRTTLRLVSSR